MRRNVILLDPEDSLGAASEMMRLGRIRQLPVADGERVIGELSYRDTCAAFATIFGGGGVPGDAPDRELAELRSQPVESFMQPPSDWADPEEPLFRVAERIVRRGSGFVLVVEANDQALRILGVVTERDLLQAAVDTQGH